VGGRLGCGRGLAAGEHDLLTARAQVLGEGAQETRGGDVGGHVRTNAPETGRAGAESETYYLSLCQAARRAVKGRGSVQRAERTVQAPERAVWRVEHVDGQRTDSVLSANGRGNDKGQDRCGASSR